MKPVDEFAPVTVMTLPTGQRWAYRVGTTDATVWQEMAEYTGLMQPVEPRDRWLDLGANVGAFSVMVGPLCAGVMAVEPAPGAFAVLLQNIRLAQLSDKVHPLFGGLAPRGVDRVKVFLTRYANKTNQSTVRGSRQREVFSAPGFSLGELLSVSRANKVKLDIEGGEYDVVMEGHDWSGVSELLVEYHPLGDGDEWRRAAWLGVLREVFPYCGTTGVHPRVFRFGRTP